MFSSASASHTFTLLSALLGRPGRRSESLKPSLKIARRTSPPRKLTTKRRERLSRRLVVYAERISQLEGGSPLSSLIEAKD
jgi:hypothetical protein